MVNRDVAKPGTETEAVTVPAPAAGSGGPKETWGRGMTSIESFYEDLTDYYHLLYLDWVRAVVDQGRILDRLITRRLGGGPRRILDAACGIGTQAISLALCGHWVQGSDLSASALARALAEAKRFKVDLPVRQADMRRLSDSFEDRFEVVAVLDNSLAHIMSQPDLEAVAEELAAVLEPGGLLLCSLRDYDRLILARPATTPIGVYADQDGRRLVFQVWDWDEDGAGYDQTLYILRHRPEGIETLAFKTRSRALTRADMETALAASGFQDVRWSEPEASGFYQPLVTARRG